MEGERDGGRARWRESETERERFGERGRAVRENGIG
jgi:hypothetical protein